SPSGFTGHWPLFSLSPLATISCRPPGPAGGAGRAQTHPRWLRPATDCRIAKARMGLIWPSGPSILLCTEPGNSCSENPAGGFAARRDTTPRPPCSTGGVRTQVGGVLPWDEARSAGGDVAARDRPTSSWTRRRLVAGGVAVENILLHVLPRGRGATIPGTGRRPGQTAERARSTNEITTSGPSPTSEFESTRARRHFHHTGCREAA